VRHAALLLAAYCAVATAEGHTPPGVWERLYGTSNVTAVSGNRGLTAGVDAHGRLDSLRWPSPGYNDQLESRPEVSTRGAFWAVRVADRLYRMDGPPWGQAQRHGADNSTVIITEGEDEDGIRVEQTLFVHAERDLLVAHVCVTGTQHPPTILWFQNLAPCTRKLEGVPIADWLLDGTNDFAVYYDEKDQTFYHFRPDTVDRATWERARYLADKPAAPWSWRVFGEGVWAALGSDRSVETFDCIGEASEEDTGALLGRPSASAPCRVAMELRPAVHAGGHEATIYLAFARTHALAQETVAFAREQGYDGLRGGTEAYWRAWLTSAALSLEHDPDESLRRRALLTLAQCTDRETGSVVASPVTGPPLALVTPRASAWASFLYDVAGYPEEAGAALRFLGSHVRSTETPVAPRGSIPAALYADGMRAAPESVVDVDGAGWWISACLRHIETLDVSRRAEFASDVWPGVFGAADFLTNWVLMPTGEPYPAYQADHLRDGQSVGTLFLARLGIESAVKLAAAGQDAVPRTWREALTEFEARIRFRAINQGDVPDDAWALDPLLPTWLRGLLPGQDRIWNARVRHHDAVYSLRDIAGPETLARLGQEVEPTAVGAALRYLAATARIYAR